MSGAAPDPDFEGEDAELPHFLVAEMEQHARALLRDVICGYLSPDLKSVADDILLASSDPIEIRARDIRGEEEETEAIVEPEEPAPEPEPTPAKTSDGPGTAADPRSFAWAVPSLPGPRTKREPPARVIE